MSKLLEFLLGSILITVFTFASVFFFALHYLLRATGITDCAWYGSAKTWIDMNNDGLINHGEPPLSDVAIHVDDAQSQLIDIGKRNWSAITNTDGVVQFNVPIPECSETLLEIYVDVPMGYHITTSPRLEVNGDFWGSLTPANTYYFGFVSDR